MIDTRQLVAVALTVMLASQVDAGDATVKTKLSLQYWRCIAPANVSCTALSDRDFKRCPKCQEWGAYVSSRVITGTISEAVYIDHDKPANQFVKDILIDFYQATPEVAAKYTPYKIAALYDHPSQFGWVELPRPQAGCLVIDRRKAAFALQDLPSGVLGREPVNFRKVLKNPSLIWELLHPSARRGGTLSLSDAKYLFRNEAPKALLPNFIIEAATSEPAEPIPVGWNAWFETPPGPQYQPSRHLAPNHSYNLVVHTAPFAYQHEFGTPAGSHVQERLGARVRRTRANNMKLTAVALTDDTFLRLRSTVFSFTLDVRKLRAWDENDTPEIPLAPLETLAKGADEAPWVFSELLIPVVTTAREGRTRIGISIWDEEAWPIDEFVIPVCISAPERANTVCAPDDVRFTDVTSFDLDIRRRGAAPAAAIHIVSLGDGGVTGLFHRGDVKGAPYIAWKMSATEDDFMRQLAHVSDLFARAQLNPEALARAGEAMHGLIFATNDPLNVHARRAQEAFAAFARRYIAGPIPTAATPPSLFVRFLTNTKQTRLVPFGLAKIAEGATGFAGMHFRIEVPLARQTSEPAAECVTNWMLVAPSATAPEFPGLRDALQSRLPKWTEHATAFERMALFREWMRSTDEDTMARALVVFSHHASVNGISELGFDPDDTIASTEIQRNFRGTTVAVLNACGTGQPGGEDFITALNQHGVDSIITTFHAVTPEIALDYFDCLASALPSRGKKQRDLATAHFDAVQCLAHRKDATGQVYGAAALAYGLAGDGRVRLCQPEKQ